VSLLHLVFTSSQPSVAMSEPAHEALSIPCKDKDLHRPLENGEATAGSQPFFTPPSYTMKEIHDAIPLHCFQRNTRLSLFYIIRDFVFAITLASIATQIVHLPFYHLRVASWAIYAFGQGLVFTGLWELAHECGHQALSPSKAFNNTAGIIIHSFLLVPYHSWRFTHAQHHKATNNIEKDIAFVPDTKVVWLAAREARSPKALFAYWDLIEDMPIVNLIILVAHQLVAWPSTSVLRTIPPTCICHSIT
jgi:omega-6 fatty acid desaturase (delta-12 desaturase)